MQTTIYLGSDAIQILQGDVRSGKLTISKHLTVEMGPGAMINGVITNEDMLLDAIDQADEAGDIDFHSTNLVINSSQRSSPSCPTMSLRTPPILRI